MEYLERLGNHYLSPTSGLEGGANSMASLGKGWETATQGIFEQDESFHAMPDTQINSQGIFGDIKDWWGKTPWTGSGGKFDTLAGYGGKIMGGLGAINSFRESRAKQKYLKQALADMQYNRQLTKASVLDAYAGRERQRALNQGMDASAATSLGEERARQIAAQRGLA